MKVSIYAASCPKCGHRAVVHSRNQPPGCACSLYSKKGCDGILGPWMFTAETETRVDNIEDLGSVTLTLGGDPLFETKPAPPGPTPEGEDLANEIKATAARKLYERNKELDRLNADLHDQIRDNQQEISRLNGGVADEARRIDALNQRNKALRAEVGVRDEEIVRLQRKLAESQINKAEFWNRAATDNANEVNRLKAQVKAYDEDRRSELAKADQLQTHVARQNHMLDNAAILLEAGASTIDTVQKALDKAEAKLEQCEVALTEARMQRDYNAKTIDSQTETIDQLRQELTEAIRKLHE